MNKKLLSIKNNNNDSKNFQNEDTINSENNNFTDKKLTVKSYFEKSDASKIKVTNNSGNKEAKLLLVNQEENKLNQITNLNLENLKEKNNFIENIELNNNITNDINDTNNSDCQNNNLFASRKEISNKIIKNPSYLFNKKNSANLPNNLSQVLLLKTQNSLAQNKINNLNEEVPKRFSFIDSKFSNKLENSNKLNINNPCVINPVSNFGLEENESENKKTNLEINISKSTDRGKIIKF